jgi:GDSL-like Lipase/Acylhydrolase family
MRRLAFRLIAAGLSTLLFGAVFYLVLRRDGSLSLRVRLDLKGDRPTAAEVFWGEGGNGFEAVRRVGFPVRPGPHEYVAIIPVGVSSLRIDPCDRPCEVEISEMSLGSWRALQTWDASNGFRGWSALHDIDDFEVRGSALVLEAGGADPYFAVLDLGTGFRAAKRRTDLELGLAAGIPAGILFTFLGAPRGPGPAPAGAAVRRLPLANLALLAASVGLSAWAGTVLYRLFTKQGSVAPVGALGLAYAPALVDQSGRALSEKRGALKLMIDPFTSYRNLPGQRTDHFSVDADGFRGEVPSDERPLAAVLGGSATFGLGLEGDADTFVALLNRRRLRYRFANAGVVGFLSGQELGLMVHQIDAFRPRLYVVFDGWNDMFLQLFPHRRSRVMGFNPDEFGRIQDRLLDHHLEQVPLPEPGPPVDPWVAEYNRDEAFRVRQIVSSYVSNLEKMASFARSRGAGLLVVFQPELSCKKALVGSEPAAAELMSRFDKTHASFPARYRELVDEAAKVCAASGIDCHDLDRGPEVCGSGEELFLDGVHLNRRGQELVAGVIEAHLPPPE